MTEVQPQLLSGERRPLDQPRVAVICDFREENWPSMELVGNMILEHLERQFPNRLQVARICPPMRRRFGLAPVVGKQPLFQNADRLVNRFRDYARFLQPQVGSFDLFHLVDHSYSHLVHVLPADRTVVTCHDLDTFRCVLQPEREPRPMWFRAMVGRILTGFRKSAHVLAVSASTRAEILSFGLLPPERVSVVPNGLHPAFSAEPDSRADLELSQLLPSESADDDWLLSVGSSIRRKRLDLLLRVFAEVRKEASNVRLLRIGEAFTDEQRALAHELGIESGITELGSVPSHVLAAAYRRAALLLQTSDTEGFGLPLIEAMGSGCAVIASDLPVLREVGGVAAKYCAIGDIPAWKRTILHALADPSEARRVRQSGLTNAARFSWAENAAQTVRIYEQIMGRLV